MIAALMIALTVLASVVLLNTVHTSPDVTVRSDASGLADTDRSATELRDELRTAFLAANASEMTTNDNRLAYADQTHLKSVVKSIETEYNDLASTDRAMVVNVTYNHSAAVEGALTYYSGSGSMSLSGSETLLEDADGKAPLVSLNATTDLTLEFNDTDTNTSRFLNVTSTSVEFNGSDIHTFNTSSFVQVDFHNGTGEIRTVDDFYGNANVDFGDFNNVTLHDSSTSVGSTIEISAEGATCGSGSVPCVDDAGMDLNPTFIVRTADPSVTYETQFTLFEVSGS
ncbi:conserved hypothetical protein [Halorhabdus tiamatea SARL4B]|uniref:Uncharacterized protein n=1 Tax=Halorhabdus tiamatea SARL4B TaxID=1033806 RepID=S6CVZ4_9EURY|nr:hypothetical protein [Halorhabdus tiamatea]CCQ34872.1 conserved hypothetical protein [Halorhabdus tiamatea SARL4B]